METEIQQKQKIEIINIPVSELLRSWYNPRKMTKRQVENLKQSIERFGFVDPVIINSNPERKNVVIGGHQRVHIAQMLGIQEVPCVQLNLSEEQEKELNLRLNKNQGKWDWDLLANSFDDTMLHDVGFTDHDLGMHEPDAEEGEESDGTEWHELSSDDEQEESAKAIDSKEKIKCPNCGTIVE